MKYVITEHADRKTGYRFIFSELEALTIMDWAGVYTFLMSQLVLGVVALWSVDALEVLSFILLPGATVAATAVFVTLLVVSAVMKGRAKMTEETVSEFRKIHEEALLNGTLHLSHVTNHRGEITVYFK